eukprot:1701578-Pyramimonas_sp.AAC.1
MERDKQLRGLSVLEQRAVRARTGKSCVKELKSVAKWAEVDEVQDVDSDRLDALLVMYLEEPWLKGGPPSRGMK